MVEVFVYFSYSVSYYIRDPIFRIVLVLCIERLHDICCRTLMFFDDNFLDVIVSSLKLFQESFPRANIQIPQRKETLQFSTIWLP